jgi:hypothetical protein
VNRRQLNWFCGALANSGQKAGLAQTLYIA